MPFTHDQFFDLFERYNRSFLPAIGLCWFAAAVLTAGVVRKRQMSTGLLALTTFQWAWVGVVFHLIFFTQINPSAWAFGILFVAHAVVLARHAFGRDRIVLEAGSTVRHAVAACLMGYALLYPAFSVMVADQALAAPLFLVPCPLVIFETGLLMTLRQPVPRMLFVAPAIWSLIGGSAAVLFGVLPDLMLFACALLLIVGAFRQGTAAPALRKRTRRHLPWSRTALPGRSADARTQRRSAGRSVSDASRM